MLHLAYGFAIFFSAEAVISLVNACVNISGRLTISVPVCGSRMASVSTNALFLSIVTALHNSVQLFLDPCADVAECECQVLL